MNIKDFIEWLQQFPEETEIEVLQHTSGTGWYDQGGNIKVVKFDPENHSVFTDFSKFSDKDWVKEHNLQNTKTLQLGLKDQ